jgi:hypothetical protein
MKKLRHVSVMLFGGVLAAGALATPSMALGPMWGPAGTQHLLTSTGFRLDAHIAGVGTAGATCAHTSMLSDVRAFTQLTVTDAAFVTCQGTGVTVNCTATVQASSLPWVAVPSTMTHVTLNGVQVAIKFENRPGTGTTCGLPTSMTVTGNLGGGMWTAAQHQIEFLNDTGLTTSVPGLLGTSVTTASGTLRDATQTLTLM